jgi:hypothetical protein
MKIAQDHVPERAGEVAAALEAPATRRAATQSPEAG